MQLELYQQETTSIAHRQSQILDEACEALAQHRQLRPIEMNGVLHALQVLIENAIGKAKHWLKYRQQPVPVSAYDTFQQLVLADILDKEQLPDWYAVIGLRNRIVHDYMNIDTDFIVEILRQKKYSFVLDFLFASID